MTINELMPVITSLSHADKLRLVQIVLQQLAQEEGMDEPLTLSPTDAFDPRRYFGVGQSSREDVDAYLKSAREGWN
ncbi:MAG: hypothetical protein BroJett021_12270 [Chloroflexota bacterium]|jgi:hypothetical protein|nr:hypothetical protein [Caldilinea sp.]GIK72239.1 MAG: hypothetical protein BroJett021_12270 [Chloroflexota bacterium]